MTLLYLNSNPRNRITDAAGYATHMMKTIKGFEAAGHRVIRFLASEKPGAAEAKEAYRTMRRRVPPGVAKLTRDLYEIVHDRRFRGEAAGLVAEGKPDFLYERANAFHSGGQRLARSLGIPHVLEVNDPLRESVSMHFSILKPYAVVQEDSLIRRADLVILGSEALRRHYARRGFDDGKLLVLYPSADEAMFSPSVDGAAVREELGLGNATVVGFVGSMAAWHRVDLFLAALSRLTSGGPGVKGLLVGELSASAADGSVGLPPGLVATGKVPYSEVPRSIAAMDVCVIANATWYGSPTKLFEYAAMGKAVVAPRFSPIEEIIEDGRSGLLFAPGSVEEMAGSIERLARDPALRRRLAAGLLERVSRWTWESNTKKVVEFMESRVAVGAC
jgi:glycosyltransferase involved in cell wall biosynthesis